MDVDCVGSHIGGRRWTDLLGGVKVLYDAGYLRCSVEWRTEIKIRSKGKVSNWVK